MRAVVVQHVDVAACVADHEDGTARNEGAEVVSGCPDLALVSDVEPGSSENPLLLGIEHFRRYVHAAVYAILRHQAGKRHRLFDHR